MYVYNMSFHADEIMILFWIVSSVMSVSVMQVELEQGKYCSLFDLFKQTVLCWIYKSMERRTFDNNIVPFLAA